MPDPVPEEHRQQPVLRTGVLGRSVDDAPSNIGGRSDLGASPSRRPGGRINVALVDSHTVVREGLRALIDGQDDLRVVDGAQTLRGALAFETSPDVIVTSLELPDAQGDVIITGLRQRFRDSSVVVLCVVDRPAFVQQMLAAGANGYLLKTASAHDLFDGIRAVAGGGTFLQASLGVMLARWRDGTGGDGPGGNILSPREVRVLGLVAIGHTNAEVAALLGVSLRTVETHRARLLMKLGRPSRAELVRYATELGLIGPVAHGG
jgi:two-component system response regulator NreC